MKATVYEKLLKEWQSKIKKSTRCNARQARIVFNKIAERLTLNTGRLGVKPSSTFFGSLCRADGCGARFAFDPTITSTRGIRLSPRSWCRTCTNSGQPGGLSANSKRCTRIEHGKQCKNRNAENHNWCKFHNSMDGQARITHGPDGPEREVRNRKKRF